MNQSETTPWLRVVLSSAGAHATVDDVIRTGFFLGELTDPWERFIKDLQREAAAAESGEVVDDDAVQAISEEFRSDRDLISAEETEAWLGERGVSLEDFSNYCVRKFWAQTSEPETEFQPQAYSDAPLELRDRFRVEILLTGEFDRVATHVSWRLAAREAFESDAVDADAIARERQDFLRRLALKEEEVSGWLECMHADEIWLDAALATEAIFHRQAAALMTSGLLERTFASLRLPLTRFDIEVLQLESLDAAREAALCVSLDGMELKQVAEAEAYPFYRRTIVFEQFEPEMQQALLRAAEGDVLQPFDLGEGVQLCRLLGKIEPELTDERVRGRLEREIIGRHFGELAAAHVRWALTPG